MNWAKQLQQRAKEDALAWHNAAAPRLNYMQFQGRTAGGPAGFTLSVILSLNK